MEMIRFKTGTCSEGTFSKKIEQGRYAGVYFHVSGTLSPAANLDRDDVGWIKVTKKGHQVDYVTFGYLHRMNDIEFGYPYNDPATTEDAFGFECFLPFGKPTRDHPSGENAHHVHDDDLWVLSCDWDAVIQAAETSFYDIALVPADLPEAYIYQIVQGSLPISGAGSFPEPLLIPNMAAFYIVSANIDEVDVLLDGKEAIDYAVTQLQRATALFGRIESGTLDMFKVDIAETARLTDLANQKVKLNLVASAADTVNFVSCAGQFSADRTKQSVDDVARTIQSKIAVHPEVSVVVSVLGAEKSGHTFPGDTRKAPPIYRIPPYRPFVGVPVSGR